MNQHHSINAANPMNDKINDIDKYCEPNNTVKKNIKTKIIVTN